MEGGVGGTSESHWWSADIAASQFQHWLTTQLVLAPLSISPSRQFPSELRSIVFLAAVISALTAFMAAAFSASAFTAASFSAAALLAARLSLLKILLLLAFFRQTVPLSAGLGGHGGGGGMG